MSAGAWREALARLPLRLGRRLPPEVRRLLNAARGIETPHLLPRPPGREVAVLAPHPDDELIGAGGTLAKHVAAGEAVTVLFLTSGERTAGLAGLPPDRRKATREAEARAATAAVGIAPERLRFLGYPDGGVGEGDLRPLADALEALAPDLLYLPTPLDAHRDHVATARLLAACLPGLASVARVALYEVWSPVTPNCLVDVTDHLERKLAGLACYESALASVDYLHTARGLAAYRSAQANSGRGYAEAFLVLEPDPFLELTDRLG